jgi:hypothetical protein
MAIKIIFTHIKTLEVQIKERLCAGELRRNSVTRIGLDRLNSPIGLPVALIQSNNEDVDNNGAALFATRLKKQTGTCLGTWAGAFCSAVASLKQLSHAHGSALFPPQQPQHAH